ncbi:hypothetical protein BDN71DRAFT_1512056 [Pleurotus eryngii]|uniref:CxC2-like cysteine cluster KDZ transposase-associated domain-containing protein n=1 Tax=Pleurotus eryngii TaxID=5323 RepID=A0A9P5ZL62_PLEER|nr:hypothetical protein BDN71DRAFT_1512056 [Pleurotus eryngii]
MGTRKGAPLTNGKPRQKFRLSSARDKTGPLKGSIHARTVTVSDNLRRAKEMPRILHTQGEVEPTAFDWNPSENFDGGGEYGGGVLREHVDAGVVRKRYAVSDTPMHEWRPYSQEYLMERLRLEGRGDAAALQACPTCGIDEAPEYTCDECFEGLLECRSCFLSRHLCMPLHRAKRWSGAYYECVSMADLGLSIQLGHPLDLECVNLEPGHKSFTVIHNNGVHMTRYKSFFLMVRQFRTERMFKHGGRGSVEGLMADTGKGQLALKCPACPEPSVNLPEGWQAAISEKRHLYSLLVSLDANFRLKNRLRFSDEANPGLVTGLAYFVEPTAYSTHLKKYSEQKDTSNCSGFKTLAAAESKFSAGMRVTGVGMCVCSRHEMVRPLGIGDLQKGERYCNMDWILLSAINSFSLFVLYIIYDIACQYKIHFKDRMAALPEAMRLPEGLALYFAIPKCHCLAHKQECQTPHSLNLMPGVGRTDGEGIERDWAGLNPVANSTKEMGPGGRHDTLDDHIAHHNWRKLAGLGDTLHRRLWVAIAESSRQTILFQEFTSSIEVRDKGIIEGWTRMVMDWEIDKTKPNPYEVAKRHSAKSQKDVRLELIEEERKVPLAHKTTPTTFLTTSMDIEDAQRKVRNARNQLDMTPAQAEDLQKCRLTIQRSLTWICTAQRIYMPILVALDDDSKDEPSQRDIEDEPVWLPSLLDTNQQATCSSALVEKEDRLWEAQCHDALDSIHSLQRGKAQYIIYKNRNVRGQRPSTRARASLDRLDEKIWLKAAQYRDARRALVRLWGTGDWESTLRPLSEEDLRPPAAFDIDDPDDAYGPDGHRKSKKKMKEIELRLREGYKHTSWVWAAGAALPDDEDLETSDISDVVRVEWAKARACSQRWQEEVALLREEMRLPGSDLATLEGAEAYAKRQAAVYVALKDHFTYLWEQPLRKRLWTKPIAVITLSGAIEGHDDESEEDDDTQPASNGATEFTPFTASNNPHPRADSTGEPTLPPPPDDDPAVSSPTMSAEGSSTPMDLD